MRRRQSERFDSTVEVGELEPYEETVEGSEASKHWLAFGQPVGGIELGKQVNETKANSSANACVGWERGRISRQIGNSNAVTMF